ncbi:hypothetical protein MIN45_P0115 [Methylomarinovum tepidoasis]|uniref:Uncharacterized protein n=1 Tax=Methylomarinovum tepidoasis TaxID=2840183 RepID=A0AAU9BWG8_9GAMM|nr:hypothetical protein [Methylomarinovum sp. IN45]BCX87748.1 hypothetical protein MIN45_P0115 [Methylomarinovum sp. IN45]
MKLSTHIALLFTALSLGGLAFTASADCASPPVGDAATVLRGKTICVTDSSTGEKWQEYHAPSGALIDYKKGPSDPVDPSKTVGSWSTSGAQVTYTYGQASYSYTVTGDATSGYSLCGAKNFTNVTLLSGQQPCP